MCLRLNFIVEGQTEERFVNTVLRDHFADQSIVAVAHCVTTRRERRAEHLRHRGGLTTYKHARDDIHTDGCRRTAAGTQDSRPCSTCTDCRPTFPAT